MPVTPFYRLFWENGFHFDYSNDPAGTFEQIRKKSPQDVQGYEDFLKYSKEVFDEGYTKLAHVPFLDWWSMVRVAPQLMRLSAHRSVFKTVARFIKDRELRQAFSFHTLLVGGNSSAIGGFTSRVAAQAPWSGPW
jgi:phytoene desaturase